MASPDVFDPLTRYQCCPPTCGAAAAILCSDDFAKRTASATPSTSPPGHDHRLRSQLRRARMIKMVGYDMTKAAAPGLRAAGLGPEDVDVVELHDCFTANELLTYEAPGPVPRGRAEKFIWDGDNTYGGRVVTNPSGGLLSKGHPLGATGLAQCTELVWQLRGQAEQAPGRRRPRRAAAQPRPGRRLRGDDVPPPLQAKPAPQPEARAAGAWPPSPPAAPQSPPGPSPRCSSRPPRRLGWRGRG
jgi:acetyl-CoA acetyltransferase